MPWVRTSACATMQVVDIPGLGSATASSGSLMVIFVQQGSSKPFGCHHGLAVPEPLERRQFEPSRLPRKVAEETLEHTPRPPRPPRRRSWPNFLAHATSPSIACAWHCLRGYLSPEAMGAFPRTSTELDQAHFQSDHSSVGFRVRWRSLPSPLPTAIPNRVFRSATAWLSRLHRRTRRDPQSTGRFTRRRNGFQRGSCRIFPRSGSDLNQKMPGSRWSAARSSHV